MQRMRTRWAAIGAAVAVAVGAGGVGLVDAARGSGERSVYTAIASCRLVDTRPEHGIGGRTTPLGPGDVHTISARGNSGECRKIAADATAVSLNITALKATQATHLTVWPGGAVPNSSSLNPAPGQPPVPNAVTTPLSAEGTFDIFNFAGSVHIVVDLVGYHQDHHHDDRYPTKSAVAQLIDASVGSADGYTKSQVDQALSDKADTDDVYTTSHIDQALSDKADVDDVYTKSYVDQALASRAAAGDVWTKAQSDSRYESKQAAQLRRPYPAGDHAFGTTLSSPATLVASIPVSLPNGGEVVANYSGTALADPGQLVECSVGTTSSFQYAAGSTAVEMGSNQDQAALSGTRHLVFASQAQTQIRLVCKKTAVSGASIVDASLTVMVFPY